MSTRAPLLVLSLAFAPACSGGDGGLDLPSTEVPLPAASCAAVGGTATVAPPVLTQALADRWHEGWLASPAVADLDDDGTPELVVPRADRVLVFHADGSLVWSADVAGRVWSSPVVADLLPARAGLEVAVAARGRIYGFGADGSTLPGFPITSRDELRSLAAGDVDGSSGLELVAVTTNPLPGTPARDIVFAYHADGSPVAGFPPNTSGASGCDDTCYVTGGYDQNLALGNVDGDAALEVFATQDNAYLSLHEGDGEAFAAAGLFSGRPFFHGVRFLLDYAEAQMGYSDDEARSLQAHFTNSAPALADLDGDGRRELVVLGSVQTTNQLDRFRGVVLFALHPDGTRLAGWEAPFHEPSYLAGLWDFDGTNYVGATNQPSVAELFPDHPGPEIVFAGFDGRIHLVDASGARIWSHVYTTSERVLTGGVAIGDLSRDGVPEIVFATYGPDAGTGELIVLDAGGRRLHTVDLPPHGSMAVPTLADADADGTLDIVVALKEQDDRGPLALVFEVPGSAPGCTPWATGRRDLTRGGSVP